jgi:hypothetical protein
VTERAERWQLFAVGVALALGLNLWLSIVVLPALFVGVLRHGMTHASTLMVALLPLGLLLVGVWRRSETFLLLLFPLGLLAPVALAPAMVSAHVYGPLRFTLVGLGLVAYLLGVSFFTSFREAPPPAGIRPLASSRQPQPERWRRRVRVYRGLVALSVVVPGMFLYLVNFDGRNQAFLVEMFPGRVTAMTTVIDLAVIALWLALYMHAFLGVLKPHRSGDRDLVASLGLAREQARRGRPRPLFYVGVFAALAGMVLLLALRHM